MMDEMARHGRYGDTMLVHMNPVEVAGLASLSPTGRLSTNPVTGQPEAFIPLLFGGLGSLLKLSPLMTGVLTGAGTAAVTGDLKRGILSGLTAGFGAGAADAAGLADPIASSADAATQAAQTSVLEQGLTGIPEASFADTLDLAEGVADVNKLGLSDAAGSSLGGLGEGIEQARAAVPDALKMQPEFLDTAVDKLGFTGNLAGAGITAGMEEQMKMEERFANQARARQAEVEADRREAFDDLQFGYAMAQPGIPTGLSAERSEMSYRTPSPMYAAGGGQVRGMEEGGKTYPGGQKENPYAERYASLGAARDIARFMGGARGYFGVDPVTVQQRLRGPDVIAPPRDYMPGFEPEFNYFQDASEGISMPDRSYRPMRQGVISRSQYFDPVLQAPQSNAQMNEYRRTLEKMDPGPLDIGSIMGLASEGSTLSTPQQNLFGQYMAPTLNADQRDRLTELMDRGMSLEEAIANQEFARSKGYDLDGDGVVTDAEFKEATTEPETDTASQTATGDTSQTARGGTSQSDYAGAFDIENFDLDKFASMYPELANFNLSTLRFQGGGQMPEVMLQTSLGATSVPGGGIAQVPTEFTAQNQMPSMDEMQMLSMAVLGQVESSDQIVNMFVQKYGPEVFRQAREMILQSVVPNAQTEGMIRGNGSGMDDAVQGMIGNNQPVAVSPGEFIVPADVVSGLGEGSSDAGAEKLDEMMDKVRMERNGTTRQAPPIDERKVMPT
tara:strand:+ start:48 stop:2231 length:2184 start_codon:yes stop_codon:yes gene_type:complete